MITRLGAGLLAASSSRVLLSPASERGEDEGAGWGKGAGPNTGAFMPVRRVLAGVLDNARKYWVA